MKTLFKLTAMALFCGSTFFISCAPPEVERPNTVDGGDIHTGGDDSLDAENIVSQDSLNKVLELMANDFGQIKAAQMFMHGGKYNDAGAPDAASEHQYQLQFNLLTDNYCGYLCLPQNFAGRLPSIYYINPGFNAGPASSFILTKDAIAPIMNNPLINALPDIKAIALLIYSYSSQEMADLYGPFPYDDYKKNKQGFPYTYESVSTIYKGIVKNIDDAVKLLNSFEQRPEYYKEAVQEILNNQDVIAKKNIKNWVKFANSLKLRMAMHIVKVEPNLAQTWAEEAVADGVISAEGEQIFLPPGLFGKSHPFSIIAFDWKDTRLNASFESMLRSLQNPMLEVLFEKNNKAISSKEGVVALPKETKIVGLRAGIKTVPRDGGQNFHVNYSRPTSAVANENLYFIRLSEVLFLRSEGALRGWNMGGTAQSFYEEGLRNAYAGAELNYQYQEKMDNYMAVEQAVPYTYEDPNDNTNNHESVTKVGVKWNESDDNEVKLEKIITQKYISNYPYSFESWTDLRRTGYPRIFSVEKNLDAGDGSIASGDIVRRLLFPQSVGSQDVKNDIQATGVPALGGPDQQGTRLWWDVKKGNF